MDNKNIFYYDEIFNQILLEYYTYINNTLSFSDEKTKDFVFYIIEHLDLKKEIKNIIFESKLSCSGYYDYNSKTISLNFDEMIKFYKLNIINRFTLLTEYLTALLHEIAHAVQYRYLCNLQNSTISKMKLLSNELKDILSGNITLHTFFPDEREASIESAKILYSFAQQNNLDIFSEMNSNLIYYLTDGYLKLSNGIYINPISRLNNYKTKYVIQKFNDIKTLSNYERLLYGFQLDDSLQDKLEFSKVNQTIGLSLKKTLKI